MLLIKSLNLNSKFFLTFFLAFSFCFSATGEEAVDIWNEKKDKTEEKILRKNNISQEIKIDFSKNFQNLVQFRMTRESRVSRE